MTRRRAVALVATLALGTLAAGCGDDEEAGRRNLAALVDEAPTTTDEPSTTPDADAEDQAEAEVEGAPSTADVEVSGEPLAFLFDGDDPAIGETAPELAGTSLTGEPMEIRHDGTPRIVVFVAHWCPHCQAEVPVVVDWLGDGGLPDDVELVAVSTAVDEARDNFPPAEWLEREGWAVPTLVDTEDGAAHLAYGAGGFPYFVVLDGDGRVVLRSAGERSPDGLDELVELARDGA
ncbi:TlpA family protein disulfide reductase [Actinomarinicola tropica]|uniref:Redoxin family protein n=1 Tax=Actinomarinicola tropica TaxID=2789776 RepID=A0A5Q2RGG1_9ACTN|nr:TlpA disulfide reductase family protein [Actinomarinicola tropica]QGG94724.1 redoxin family protein [Actinomarinicola tropica]